MLMQTDDKVMAIVLNYKNSTDVKKCVSFLKKQNYKNLLITIVDNNSPDDSEQILKSFSGEQGTIYIQSGKNRGFSAGNNVGLRKASELGCKYALIVNPDVEIRDENYIEKAICKMNEDHQIVVLGSDINMNEKHQNPMRELNLFENIFWFVMLAIIKICKKDIYVGDYKRSGYTHKVSGCCFFVKMNFAEKIGYLDESTFMYCEEPILAAQVKKSGYREYYFSDITAYHMHKELQIEKKADELEKYLDSRRYYIQKYRYRGIIKLLVLISLRFEKKIMCYRAKR